MMVISTGDTQCGPPLAILTTYSKSETQIYIVTVQRADTSGHVSSQELASSLVLWRPSTRRQGRPSAAVSLSEILSSAETFFTAIFRCSKIS